MSLKGTFFITVNENGIVKFGLVPSTRNLVFFSLDLLNLAPWNRVPSNSILSSSVSSLVHQSIALSSSTALNLPRISLIMKNSFFKI